MVNELESARAIPEVIGELRLVGYDAQGSIRFSEVQSKAPELLFDEIPLEVTSINVEYLRDGVILGLATVEVELVAGEVLDLNDLDFVDVGSIIENLQIEPPNPSVAAGTSQVFTLTGTRITASGSARVELTSSANWSSGSPATATIDTDGLALAATAETAVLRMETAATLENLEALAGRTGRGLPVTF